jgi:arylformamidase
MIYDISRPVTTETAVWPGDTAYQVARSLSLAQGDSVNLTTLTLSAHTGTHIDAYYHYADDGAHPAQMPLAHYLGPARVVTIDRADGPLAIDDLPDTIGIERLLIHSPVSDLPDTEWPQSFPYLSLPLIEHLAQQGIRLIGLDSPSVDAFSSTDLPCHKALRAHNMVNIESLYLRAVPDGDYFLVALPLKLDAACGSPVRAVLYSL